MDEKVNVWKVNLTNGFILGLVSIAYTLILYFLNLSTNKGLGYAFIIIQILLMYYLIKSYRNNYLHGFITYGQAVGAGAVMCLYYAIISAIFTYVMYAIIDPGLIDKILAMSEEVALKRGVTQEQLDASMKITKRMMTPAFMAISGVFGTMFFGIVASLIVAIFVRKEGNPLLDSGSN